eukprot:1795146-Ditylum_brightwellii.AAC.1
MEMVRKYSEEGTASVKPNCQAYNSVLSGCGCSSDPNSADRAHDLLTHLVDDYEKDLQQGENKAIRPNTTSFAHAMSKLS